MNNRVKWTMADSSGDIIELDGPLDDIEGGVEIIFYNENKQCEMILDDITIDVLIDLLNRYKVGRPPVVGPPEVRL